MKNILKSSFFFLIISIFIIAPFLSLAEITEDETGSDKGTGDKKYFGGLVPCGNTVVPPKMDTDSKTGKQTLKDGTGKVSNPCDFDYFMLMINKVIDFILFKLLMPITAILFAYAGFLLVTSGGNSGKKDKAKKIFVNVAIGFIIALAAWLIVKTILNLLGFQSDII